VSEQLLNGTSAHIRPFSAIYGVYNRNYRNYSYLQNRKKI